MSAVALAARLHAHAEPLVVEEVTLPEPGPDEVLVELHHAGVNPVDRYVAAGSVSPDAPLPRTLGAEATGTVAGRAVLVAGAGLGFLRDGLWATAAIVPRSAVLPLPVGVDPVEAACAGIAGLTAWQCVVGLAQVSAADRVLVLGAAGGVGLAAVSLAAALGAQVRGQTGSTGKAGSVADAGGVPMVCEAGGLAEALGGWRPTVVIDPLGGEFTPAVVPLLATDGRLVVFGTSAGAEVSLPLQVFYRSNLRMFGYGGTAIPEAERRQGLAATLRALADGRLRIPVGARLPLAEVGRATGLLRDRDVAGKIVLDLR